ncbi:translesion DNA synthesis-associated protein ImuA [Ectothiorhodospiraceae bacterium WFHF3C12]|nr:translesion DNA synthesis-associated protein ImuA [Ectothiorhodospiraceae bacterium WFHF3C12]
MNDALNDLLQQPGIWRAAEVQQNTGMKHVSTGYSALDDNLPGNGWPQGALTELLHERAGIGELRLLIPALARLSREGRWIALIAPPYIPYAPALTGLGVDLSRVLLVHPKDDQDALWAVEQALRNGNCGAVLTWPRTVDERSLRRLQLAAEEGGTWGVLFRDTRASAQTSPAALRLRLDNREAGLGVQFLKCRGGLNQREVVIDLNLRPRTRQEAPARQPQAAHTPEPPTPKPMASPTPHPATAGLRRGRGGRRRAMQMDLPLPAGSRGFASQATPLGALPARNKGRLARLRDRLMS